MSGSRVLLALVAAITSMVVAQPAPAHADGDRQTTSLARDALRAPLTRERFYFVMPDRFENGDPANDTGGLTGPREVTGFDPTSKGWYHGGDLKGMIERLDYVKGLGTTAIWLTPSFKNKPVQGLGTEFPSAAYHGYWITDFTQIDPHLGTNQDLRDLIDGAHGRGMKVFFDIITNHTADVIDYREGVYDYIDKATAPYRDAAGNVFDDRDYAGTDSFPALDPLISFPYEPFVHAGEEDVKRPAWLNDVTLYHNRGNSTFSGESSTYGDFAGLDDLFTENPKVVRGMQEIYDAWIRDFGVDGFRIDTMKHVDIEFWQRFLPHILDTARSVGKKRFFAFGEVFDTASNPFLSRYTTTARGQAVLDFPFQQQAREFGASRPTDQLRALFEQGDWFTDADSNVYQLPTFLGNHDMGHIGMFLRDDNPGAPESELLARDRLVHALVYLSRGNPVVYFGDEQGFTGAGNDQAARQDMFPSLDPEYHNLDGKNDNIGSDVTPAADNFDPTHPLYRTIAALSKLTATHPALRDGVHQVRYSSDAAGLLAFSRTDARKGVEYLVVLNNAEETKTARIPTYSAHVPFARIYGDGPRRATSGADKAVAVTLPPLSATVLRAAHALKAPKRAPAVALDAPAEVSDRPQIAATVGGDSLYQVSFYARADGERRWTALGTDDSAPYRVFPDVSGYAVGTRLELLAVAKDTAGHVASATGSTTVVAPPGGGAGEAIVHYRRTDGYDGWGLHLWGDAIRPDQATDWASPKLPTGFDDFGAYFVIPLADASASLNFITHMGDTKDGGDRAFVPAVSREVWLVQGDPTIYTSRPG